MSTHPALAPPAPPDALDAWRSRLRRQGHTGWNDPVIYAYDQLERLALVGRVVDELGLDPAASTALDFGCGVGDFCRLLLERGFEVIGHDPVVEPAIDHPRFRFEARLSAAPVDLALSVTVLDHVLDERRLAETLASLRARLRPGGFLVLLEYAVPQERAEASGLRPGRHQAFRSPEAWSAALRGAGFSVARRLPAPHPVHAPSPGFLRYARDPRVRALAATRLATTRLGRRLLTGLARRLLASAPDAAPDPQSPLVCHVCTRSG